MYNIIGFVLGLVMFLLSLANNKPNFVYLIFMVLFALVRPMKR